MATLISKRQLSIVICFQRFGVHFVWSCDLECVPRMEQEQEVYAIILIKLTSEKRVVLNLKQQFIEKQVKLTEAKKQVEVLQVQLDAKKTQLN